jgi:hypothetical protein
MTHDAGEVIERQNGVYSGQSGRYLSVDRANGCVCMRAADKAGMQHAGNVNIVDKTAASPQQRRILDAGNA